MSNDSQIAVKSALAKHQPDPSYSGAELQDFYSDAELEAMAKVAVDAMGAPAVVATHTLIKKMEAAKYDPNADMELPYNSHQAAFNAGLHKAYEIFLQHEGGAFTNTGDYSRLNILPEGYMPPEPSGECPLCHQSLQKRETQGANHNEKAAEDIFPD